MQINIANETEALRVASSAGFESVEEFVNQFIKKEADIQALREGIADAKNGNVRCLAEFDEAFRRERNIDFS